MINRISGDVGQRPNGQYLLAALAGISLDIGADVVSREGSCVVSGKRDAVGAGDFEYDVGSLELEVGDVIFALCWEVLLECLFAKKTHTFLKGREGLLILEFYWLEHGPWSRS